MKLQLLMLLVLPGLVGVASGHTVDSVGEYRVEIGWMNEPVVSGETNAIEFYASQLEPGLELEDQIFENGIDGLKKTVKVQLIYKNQTITLPLSPDHNIPGKYYAFVNPTVAGYYQANILGTIRDTSISLSMHPPPVAERSYIEFPESSDLTLAQIIDWHTAIISDINNLKKSVDGLRETDQTGAGYAGIGMGILGVSVAILALVRSKKAAA